MKLSKIIKDFNIVGKINFKDLNISDVEYDSRKVKKDNMFFAVKGLQDDGNLFIKEAIEKGAKSVVVDEYFYNLSEKEYKEILAFILSKNIPLFVVKDVVKEVSKAAALFYEYPSRKLNVIGITGTNGKTSTCFLVEKIFNKASVINGVIGTVLYRYAGKTINKIEYTTPKSLYLQRIINEMQKEKVTHLAMEVSSHGVELKRVNDIDFDTAIFTNLTRDHMEFHKDMEDYFNAKKKLFTELLVKSTKKEKYAVVNIDSEYGLKLYEIIKLLSDIKTISFGKNDLSDVKLLDYLFDNEGTKFKISYNDKTYDFSFPLIGEHNIYNAISAIISTMIINKIKYETVKKALEEDFAIPGRLERVKKGKNIFVDYAHTDDALKNILKTLKNAFPDKKIITVFGCGGDRDKGKRPRMGKVVSDLSNYAIATTDNPRNEKPVDIINSITASMRKGSFEVVEDRKEAIKTAISKFDENTVILIAGKGHETYQIIDNTKIEFDDRKVAREFL
jgi:UDP-N-acetylmuramoyl-L-alanyl-D-glutamate--2,6-diaminopimelate ligase